MVWSENKVPIEFGKYRRRPFLFGSKYGWFFHRGEERANLKTWEFADLLGKEKAYVVIDREVWERLVARYRGKLTEDQERLKHLQERQRRESQVQVQLVKQAEQKQGELRQLKDAAEEKRKKIEEIHRRAEKLQRKP
jgi:hypothetical protein